MIDPHPVGRPRSRPIDAAALCRARCHLCRASQPSRMMLDPRWATVRGRLLLAIDDINLALATPVAAWETDDNG